ncbi:hypothetical protein ACOMHN_024541 [Nucella lapillus]
MGIVGAEDEEKDDSDKLLPIRSSQDECPMRRMKDSYLEAVIPLGQDNVFRKNYTTFQNTSRFGRLMEDLDIFAAVIGYTHNQDPSKSDFKSPLLLATAAVDRIDLHDFHISPFEDVKMRGHMTWVGKSAMEITMVLEQEEKGAVQKKLTARYVMVARNPRTAKAAVVNPLQPEGEEEQAMFQLGEKNKILRQERTKKSLLKTVLSSEERQIIHSIFVETIDDKFKSYKHQVKPDNSVWMHETERNALIVCFPEQKNIFNKIFGGFLMRQAFELAWATAVIFSHKVPSVKVVDHISFLQPVDIGSILTISAQIVYTQGSLVEVKVHALAFNILTSSQKITNEFYFTFDCHRTDLPRVMPNSYAESMLYLEGMRNFGSPQGHG